MNKQFLVSICIPVYNNENTIRDTLDSILNQTYKNIVIKLYDNASTDNTINILNEYSNKYSNIVVFQNKINIGGEANFTKCIDGLEGDFGAIYHADDIYDEKMVETQVKYLSSNDISAVFVRANLIDENLNDIGEQFFPNELKNKIYHQFNFNQLFSLILKYDNFLITPSVMGKVEIYKNQIKEWDGKQFKTSADLDVWLRFSEIQDVGLITEKLISYRLSSASFSYRTKFSRINPRDMFLVIDYYLKKYKNTIDFSYSDYEYLRFKDDIMIITNKILNNITCSSSDIKVFNYDIAKTIIQDKKKLKIYIYAMLIKLLLFTKNKWLLLRLIKQINGIKEK